MSRHPEAHTETPGEVEVDLNQCGRKGCTQGRAIVVIEGRRKRAKVCKRHLPRRYKHLVEGGSRQCQGRNIFDMPCGCPPLRPGTQIGPVSASGNYCRAHDPELTDDLRIQGPQPGSGRPRKPRPDEVAKQIIEAEVLAFLRPHLMALGLEVNFLDDGRPLVTVVPGAGAKVHGTTKDGEVIVSDHPDVEAMQKAAERLFDRVYGRPKQATEITGGPQPIKVEVPRTKERAVRVKDILSAAHVLETLTDDEEQS